MKTVWPIKLTEHAEKVLFLAEEEAGRAGRTYVGIEDILTSLARLQDELFSARVVGELGLDVDRVRAAMQTREREFYDSYLEMASRAETWAQGREPPSDSGPA